MDWITTFLMATPLLLAVFYTGGKFRLNNPLSDQLILGTVFIGSLFILLIMVLSTKQVSGMTFGANIFAATGLVMIMPSIIVKNKEKQTFYRAAAYTWIGAAFWLQYLRTPSSLGMLLAGVCLAGAMHSWFRLSKF